MYQNAGRTIKRVVSIVVKIGYGFSILAAAAILIGCLATGETEFVIVGMFGALVVGGLGCLGAWLGGLWLYAYGEIADCLISIDARLYRANLDGKSDVQSTYTAPAASAPAAPTSTPTIFCTSCGTRNDANAQYCSVCKANLINQAATPKTATPKATTGTWRCSCGRVNSGYVSSCPCGKKRQ